MIPIGDELLSDPLTVGLWNDTIDGLRNISVFSEQLLWLIGASACAIKNGESLDNSMGLTPLAGLPGATRSGSLDPRLANFLSG